MDGCLLGILEVVLEIVAYIFKDPFDKLFDAYIFAIESCIPCSALGKTARKVVEIAVIIFTLIFVFALVLGILIWVYESPYKNVGKCMVIISVSLHILQIAFGITMHYLSKKKNR